MTISKESNEATSERSASPETRSSSKGTLDTQGMDDKAITAFDLETLRIRKIFTLIFIHDKDSDQLLLGKKLRGPLLGQWNGFGGKVERGLDQSIAQSAARELQEEAFIRAPLFPIGFIQWVVASSKDSQDPHDETYRDVMVVYKAHSIESFSQDPAPHSPLSSDPCISSSPAASAVHYLQPFPSDQPRQVLPTEFMPSDEMAPAWWPIDHLPWESMRINHQVWYPFLLADCPFAGVYWYETRSSFPGDEGQNDKQSTKNLPLRKENAQRETSKEIWVEDLGKRCFQFGRRRIGSSQYHIQDRLEENQRLLTDYALRLGLACYKGGVADTLQDREGQCSTHDLGSAPVPSDSIDEGWLDGAIAKAEEDWVLRLCPGVVVGI
ncbi:Nudix (Nucleoside diphosphate linked moiety X)-type motif 1 [Mortierella antarctica]|nr:Nudix (Nucleoside diphosphate linked moiety X)-type motif 1 [Mortierella antarctica]